MKAQKTYKILVARYGIFEFSVDARSHEEACNTLQQELRAGQLKKATVGTEPVKEFWANPADKNDAWLVTASPEPNETHAQVLAWNGTQTLDAEVQPIMNKGLSFLA